MFLSLFSSAFLSLAFAQTSVFSEFRDFTNWLEKNEKKFGICEPEKISHIYKLCDGTKISEEELKALFQMQPRELLEYGQKKGLKTEVLCDDKSDKIQVFRDSCQTSSTHAIFKEITSLHGKYLPDEHAILIRSSASKGSFIHEYLHSLQSNHDEKIYGKVYKAERNRIQKKLIAKMDEEIAAIQKIEKSKDQSAMKTHLDQFMTASSDLRSFSKWQDLIDERNIFLLYLKFGKDFGVPEEDLSLAKKNMDFICANPKLRELLPASECQQKN